jgi:hypothetical protein
MDNKTILCFRRGEASDNKTKENDNSIRNKKLRHHEKGFPMAQRS